MTREAKLLEISSHNQNEIKGFCGDYGFLSKYKKLFYIIYSSTLINTVVFSII